MISCNLILFFFEISFALLEYHVFALKQDSILDGYPILQNRFGYQAAILALRNKSVQYSVICGGGIISETLLAAAAQCFIRDPHSRFEYRYSVALGTADIRNRTGIRVDVKKIYIPCMIDGLLLNDFAIVELQFSIDIIQNKLYKMPFAQSLDNFEGRLGVIAGFGIKDVNIGLNSTGRLNRISGLTDDVLTYGLVNIYNDHLCGWLLEAFNTQKQMCGTMQERTPATKTGLCTGDIGSPLIVDAKIVAIASRNNINCDDRNTPIRFTKTAPYWIFTDYIIRKQKPPDAIVLRNLLHEL